MAAGADPYRRRDAGFTLIELMVVLVIVGLAATAVLLTGLGPPRLSQEADALAVRLARARDEAVLGNRAVEVVLGPEGYSFRARGPAGWAPLGEPFEARAWSEGVQARLSGAESATSVRFDVLGTTAPAAIDLVRGAEQARVTVDGSGEVRVDAG